MSMISEWLKTAQEVIKNPSEFFSMEDRRSGFDYPLRFAAVSLVISGILSAIGAFTLGLGQNTLAANLTAALSTLVAVPIGGLIGLFIGAGIVHIFVYLLGGKQGYNRTFAVAAYSTALSPIAAFLGIIPIIGGLIGLLVSVYGLYMQIKGIEVFQNMSFGRAAAAVLLPAVIITIIALIVAFLAFSLFAISSLVTTPP